MSRIQAESQQSLGWGLEADEVANDRLVLLRSSDFFLHKGGASFSWEVFPLTATNEGAQRTVI